jgi:hypothetical protein
MTAAGAKLLRASDLSGAAASLAEAVALAEANWGLDSVEVVRPLVLRGTALCRAGTEESVREALAVLRRALEVAELRLPRDAYLRTLREYVGDQLHIARLPGDAAALYERFLHESSGGKAGAGDAFVRLKLVEALLDAERPGEALPHARQLVEYEVSQRSSRLGPMQAHLCAGRALYALGRTTEALEEFERARAASGGVATGAVYRDIQEWILRCAGS